MSIVDFLPAVPDGRLIAIGLRRWKQAQLRPLLHALCPGRLHFVRDCAHAVRLRPGPADALLCWGPTLAADLQALSGHCGARIVRMEDGYLRSVGLGSDLIAPRSLVLDAQGLYMDATQESALERLLNTEPFTPADLADARSLRDFIVRHGLSKYNLAAANETVDWPRTGRRVVLVPGQVEDDASIRLGCTRVRTNAQLLEAVRNIYPDAYIVYKPHPDVSSGNRTGALAPREITRWADHVETRGGVVSCIEACDELHTMTSLAGFDALLRGKPVTTHGLPFYAGWGLTDDRSCISALKRRTRELTLDELVAGALIRYPLYWDPVLKGFTTAMAVARQLQRERDMHHSRGTLKTLQGGWWRRQQRKAHTLWRAWVGNCP